MSIKAIETQYKGYRFRSRLEARWAVFFDAVGLAWEYEKEGFDMDGVRYLPDFYLPDSRLWVEIKADTPSQKEADKIYAFIKETEDNFLLMFGQPYLGESENAYRCEYTGIFYPADVKAYSSLNKGLRVTGIAVCRNCRGLYWMQDEGTRFALGPIGSCCDMNPRLISKSYDLPFDAYAKARAARFEHGETPN